MGMSSDEIQAQFPLHFLVWNDESEELQRVIESGKVSH